MLSSFIDEFKKTKYFEQILDANKVIFMYVAGSRILGITDERSDYDIVVVVDGAVNSESELILTYEGLRVHWYIRPLAEFMCGCGQGLRSFGAVLFGMLTTDKIIYANPHYDGVCNIILSNRKFIAWEGAHNVVEGYADLIEDISKNGVILPQNYTKILSHLCVTSCYILNHEMDETEKKYLLQIKRIRWKTTSEEAKTWCVARITALQKWYHENSARMFVKAVDLCIK